MRQASDNGTRRYIWDAWQPCSNGFLAIRFPVNKDYKSSVENKALSSKMHYANQLFLPSQQTVPNLFTFHSQGSGRVIT
jgi:hypothetical protein